MRVRSCVFYKRRTIPLPLGDFCVMTFSKRLMKLVSLSAFMLALTVGFATASHQNIAFAQDDPVAVAADDAQAELVPVSKAAAPALDEATTETTALQETAATNLDVEVDERLSFFSLFGFLWILVLACSIAALVYAVRFFKAMMKADRHARYDQDRGRRPQRRQRLSQAAV